MARLDQLLPLAKLGDVIALRAAIRKLSDEDPTLRTFCRRISILAEKYQMAAVEKILEAARRRSSGRSSGVAGVQELQNGVGSMPFRRRLSD